MEADQVLQALDKDLPTSQKSSGKAEQEHHPIRGDLSEKQMKSQRRRAKNQSNDKKQLFRFFAFPIIFFGLCCIPDRYAFLNAVANLLYFCESIAFLALKAELLGRKVEADAFKTLGLSDFLLNLARAVGAVEVFECVGVFHLSHSSTWSSPISMIFFT